MLKTPSDKYQPQPAISLPDRRWPEQRLTQAPRWLSTDLRDGNQALAEPMDSNRKLQFWALLLRCGFKEIEVAFLCLADGLQFCASVDRRKPHSG